MQSKHATHEFRIKNVSIQVNVFACSRTFSDKSCMDSSWYGSLTALHLLGLWQYATVGPV